MIYDVKPFQLKMVKMRKRKKKKNQLYNLLKKFSERISWSQNELG